jgi:hypothetical protein
VRGEKGGGRGSFDPEQQSTSLLGRNPISSKTKTHSYEGITVLNAPGIIDPGYRGEIGVGRSIQSHRDRLSIEHIRPLGQFLLAVRKRPTRPSRRAPIASASYDRTSAILGSRLRVPRRGDRTADTRLVAADGRTAAQLDQPRGEALHRGAAKRPARTRSRAGALRPPRRPHVRARARAQIASACAMNCGAAEVVADVLAAALCAGGVVCGSAHRRSGGGLVAGCVILGAVVTCSQIARRS